MAGKPKREESGGQPWDTVAAGVPLSGLDSGAAARFISAAVKAGRLAETAAGREAVDVLGELGLVRGGEPTRAAVLLFGSDPSELGANLSVRVGRLRGDTTIADDKWVSGTLFEQAEGALAAVRNHIAVRYDISGPERTEVWDYPLPALREMLLNALLHRDYADTANFIQVKVYDDRVWCANPGKLPAGIRVADLKRPHRSFLRNPLVGRAFYLAGLVEQFGSGTLRMVEAMTAAGLPEPEFREEMGGFSVYLYRDRYTEETLRPFKLSERQLKAALHAKEHGRITNREYQVLNGVSNKTAYLELRGLVAKGVMRVEGQGRTLRYVLR